MYVHVLCSLKDTQRKLRSAQFSLTDSERNKERRIKIMRKSHQAALTLKQAVITELQDIIAEEEECVSQLQVQVSNNQPTNSPLCIKQVHKYMHFFFCYK